MLAVGEHIGGVLNVMSCTWFVRSLNRASCTVWGGLHLVQFSMVASVWSAAGHPLLVRHDERQGRHLTIPWPSPTSPHLGGLSPHKWAEGTIISGQEGTMLNFSLRPPWPAQRGSSSQLEGTLHSFI